MASLRLPLVTTSIFFIVSCLSIVHPTLLSDFHILAAKRAESYQHVKFTIISSSSLDITAFPESISILLEFPDRPEWILRLKLNQGLIHRDFQILCQSGDSQLTECNDGVVHCFYHGYVDQYPDSKVALSICEGLKGSILISGEYYYIEPLLDSHIIYKHVDKLPKREKTCGIDSTRFISLSPANFSHVTSRIRKDVVSRFVELHLVMDRTLHTNLGANTNTSINYIISVANEMDMMYSGISIRIALVGVSLWESSDLISVDPDLSITLDTFIAYLPTLAMEVSTQFDNAQLITGKDNPSSTVVGYAPLSSMCLADSGGVNRDLDLRPLDIAATIAHEMGHNFGMEHDDVDNRPCYECPGSDCTRIMNAIGTVDIPVQFSQCSIDDLDANLKDGLGACIFNQPTVLFTDVKCGNKFVEEGEECDCGSVTECPSVDPCCEPGTCRLKANTECSDGPCCNNCQFLSSATLCRGKQNVCDLPEYCTGITSACPANLYKSDGSVCSVIGSSSYCYFGACRTLRTQCQGLWGTTGVDAAADICFESINTEGSLYGNCGIMEHPNGSSNFIPCADENVKCGKIQCLTPPNAELLPAGSANLTYVTISDNGQTVECTGASIDLGADIPDPGLVVEGVKCGQERICVNQECVTLSSVFSTNCPIGTGGAFCSGRGTCTNVATCQCDTGYIGLNCSQASSAHALKFSYFQIFFVFSTFFMTSIM